MPLQGFSSDDPIMTERAERLLAMALEVLGDESDAEGWMFEAIPTYGDRRPVDLLSTEEDFQKAAGILKLIKYGVYF